MCPHTTICVLILLYLCPHATTYIYASRVVHSGSPGWYDGHTAGTESVAADATPTHTTPTHSTPAHSTSPRSALTGAKLYKHHKESAVVGGLTFPGLAHTWQVI